MSLERVNVVVQGKVQGVFFRAYTKDEAEAFCLRGWVRNRPDGSVEAEIEGEGRDVRKMISWFHKGSPQSQVLKVTVSSCELVSSENNFVIRY